MRPKKEVYFKEFSDVKEFKIEVLKMNFLDDKADIIFTGKKEYINLNRLFNSLYRDMKNYKNLIFFLNQIEKEYFIIYKK